MRLLLINSIGKNKWGGGEKWMVTAASELIKRGHEVRIGCRPNSVIKQRATEYHIPVEHLSIYTDISLTGLFRLKKIVNRHRIELIIGCQNKDVRVAGALAKMMSGLTVISRQGVQLLKRTLKYKLGFVPLCDGIITNTHSIKDEYDRYGWWDKNFVKVIHNGISRPDSHIHPFEFTEYTGDERNPFVILSTGRLARQKGFNYLIDAAAKVVKIHPQAHFFIAGKGKLEQELRHQIEELKLQNNVHLIGFHQYVIHLIKGANLFVMSSLYEGMPNSLMESLANALPAVSTKVNGVSELMIDGEHGCIVEPGNAEELAKSIITMINDKNLRQKGLNAQKHVKLHFSLEKMGEELESYLLQKIQLSRPQN